MQLDALYPVGLRRLRPQRRRRVRGFLLGNMAGEYRGTTMNFPYDGVGSAKSEFQEGPSCPNNVEPDSHLLAVLPPLRSGTTSSATLYQTNVYLVAALNNQFLLGNDSLFHFPLECFFNFMYSIRLQLP